MYLDRPHTSAGLMCLCCLGLLWQASTVMCCVCARCQALICTEIVQLYVSCHLLCCIGSAPNATMLEHAQLCGAIVLLTAVLQKTTDQTQKHTDAMMCQMCSTAMKQIQSSSHQPAHGKDSWQVCSHNAEQSRNKVSSASLA